MLYLVLCIEQFVLFVKMFLKLKQLNFKYFVIKNAIINIEKANLFIKRELLKNVKIAVKIFMLFKVERMRPGFVLINVWEKQIFLLRK